MELTRVTNGMWKDWWRVTNPTDVAARHIRYSIPAQYRNYEDRHWYIHDKYVEGVQQLLASAGPSAVAKPQAPVDPYAVLHLRPTAPQAIIRAAWRELARMLHPDQGGDPEEFLRAKEAYEYLTNKG